MAELFFLPKVVRELQTVERVDTVFDTYKKYSLKGTTRRKRGVGIRRKVEKQSQVPANWHSFLRIDENKEELFRFLSEKIKAEINTIHRNIRRQSADLERRKCGECQSVQSRRS